MGRIFLQNPWFRTFIPLFLVGIAGFAGNTLVVEISVENSIDWAAIPKKASFYVMLVSTLAVAVYQILLRRFDSDLMKGFTPRQYEARIRNRVAEDVARRSQKLIQEGEIDQLEKETETFKRLYGEKLE